MTGLDIFPEAIRLASRSAVRAGVEVRFVTGDVFSVGLGRDYDLIYDSGCLHSLVGGTPGRYKERILEWLRPGGTFVVEHWGKRSAADWRPVGPRRRSFRAIVDMFSPEMHLVGLMEEDFSAPLPFGPTVRGAAYAFQLSGEEATPASNVARVRTSVS